MNGPIVGADPFLNPSGILLPPFEPGGKTTDVLDTGNGQIDLVSGRNGPASQEPKGTAGFDAYTRTHVEGHAAALMREKGMTNAKLYINNPEICSRCSQLLPRMLPPGAQLEVITPSGSTTFVGEIPIP